MNEQLTLGEIIEQLQTVGVRSETNEPKSIQYDFAYLQPTYLSSWRGDYSQLSLGYEENSRECLATNLLQNLKLGLKETFTGWKGGEYRMDENTKVWVANAGESANTGIVGLRDEGYRVIIETKYFEY